MKKHCKHCGELFEPHKRRPGQKFCKTSCQERDRHARKGKERNARRREHRAENPEKYRQEYLEKLEYNRERGRKYYWENREERLKYKQQRDAELSDQVLYWTEEALWAENTEDPEICISVASEVPFGVCWLSEDLEDFVARWLDPDY